MNPARAARLQELGLRSSQPAAAKENNSSLPRGNYAVIFLKISQLLAVNPDRNKGYQGRNRRVPEQAHLPQNSERNQRPSDYFEPKQDERYQQFGTFYCACFVLLKFFQE